MSTIQSLRAKFEANSQPNDSIPNPRGRSPGTNSTPRASFVDVGRNLSTPHRNPAISTSTNGSPSARDSFSSRQSDKTPIKAQSPPASQSSINDNAMAPNTTPFNPTTLGAILASNRVSQDSSVSRKQIIDEPTQAATTKVGNGHTTAPKTPSPTLARESSARSSPHPKHMQAKPTPSPTKAITSSNSRVGFGFSPLHVPQPPAPDNALSKSSKAKTVDPNALIPGSSKDSPVLRQKRSLASVTSSIGRSKPKASITPRTSTSRVSNSATTNGFTKPQPRPTTKPVKLPTHLTAPTASSAAKHGVDPLPKSRRTSAESTAPLRRPVVRKPNSAPQKATTKPPTQATEPVVSGLARWMQPTTSSSQKVHGKVDSPKRS